VITSSVPEISLLHVICETGWVMFKVEIENKLFVEVHIKYTWSTSMTLLLFKLLTGLFHI